MTPSRDPDSIRPGIALGAAAVLGVLALLVREQWARAAEEGRSHRSTEPMPPMVEALVDPQLRTFHSMWSEDDPPPFQPIEQRARIVSSRGLALDPNASCDVRVLPVRGAGMSCLVRVMCGSTVVYPNPSQTAGYLNCNVDESGGISGADHGPTTADGDPAIRLDSTGRVQISNLDWNGPGTAFEVEVQVDPGSMRNGV